MQQFNPLIADKLTNIPSASSTEGVPPVSSCARQSSRGVRSAPSLAASSLAGEGPSSSAEGSSSDPARMAVKNCASKSLSPRCMVMGSAAAAPLGCCCRAQKSVAAAGADSGAAAVAGLTEDTVAPVERRSRTAGGEGQEAGEMMTAGGASCAAGAAKLLASSAVPCEPGSGRRLGSGSSALGSMGSAAALSGMSGMEAAGSSWLSSCGGGSAAANLGSMLPVMEPRAPSSSAAPCR